MADDKVNGVAIRVIRERSELSVLDVVAGLKELDVEIHKGTLYNIELGYRNASPALVRALASVLKCPKVAILADPDAEGPRRRDANSGSSRSTVSDEAA